MYLRKKIDKDTIVSAAYVPTGISLFITRKGDKYDNKVVSLTIDNGEPKLTIMKNTVQHYGLKELHEDIVDLVEW